jgi:hypothetical protein
LFELAELSLEANVGLLARWVTVVGWPSEPVVTMVVVMNAGVDSTVCPALSVVVMTVCDVSVVLRG